MSESSSVEILLVEDNPQGLKLTQRSLRKSNLTNCIHISRDSAEAVEFLFCEGTHAARKFEDGPKVILLDPKLPKVNGLEVLERVKSDPRSKSIPVVVFTSSKEQNDVVESYQLGVNSYIVKPDVRVIASSGRGDPEARVNEIEHLNICASLTKPYNKNKLLMTLHDVLGKGPDSQRKSVATLMDLPTLASTASFHRSPCSAQILTNNR